MPLISKFVIINVLFHFLRAMFSQWAFPPTPILKYHHRSVHWNLPIISLTLISLPLIYSLVSLFLIKVCVSRCSPESAFDTITLTKNISRCLTQINPFMLKTTLLGSYCCGDCFTGGETGHWWQACCLCLTAAKWWSQDSSGPRAHCSPLRVIGSPGDENICCRSDGPGCECRSWHITRCLTLGTLSNSSEL